MFGQCYEDAPVAEALELRLQFEEMMAEEAVEEAEQLAA